jgi:hypothetical protein
MPLVLYSLTGEVVWLITQEAWDESSNGRFQLNVWAYNEFYCESSVGSTQLPLNGIWERKSKRNWIIWKIYEEYI